MSHTATLARRATTSPGGTPLRMFGDSFRHSARSVRATRGGCCWVTPSPPVAAHSPGSSLVGIARLAAAAPKELGRKQVEYFRLPVRSLLNRVDSRRVGFTWSINPYRGCEFGCQYCYARYTHEYMELDPRQFENKIYVKDGAARLLRRELTAEKVLGEHIAIGAATDPYQPAERRFGVTRTVLQTLLDFSRQLPGDRSLSLSLTTKSTLVLRDLDLLRELARCTLLHVNLSITTLNPRLARVLEPRVPRPDLRLAVVRQLNQAGISAGVFVAPILPGITDRREDLDALAVAAAQVSARYLGANVVFLMPSAQKKFFPFLDQKFPRLVKQYRKWFRASGYAPESYRKEIATLMGQLRVKYRLSGRWPQEDCAPTPAVGPDYSALATPAARPQLALPFAS